MKKNFSALFLALIILIPGMGFAGISFDNLAINDDDTVLYTVTHDKPGVISYSALFSHKLSGTESITSSNLPDILTCYPEQLNSIGNGKFIQVRNRFGTAIYDFENESLNWIARTSVIPEKSFSLSPVIASPDGLYLVFMRKVSSSTGELIIQEVASRKYVILDKEVPYSYSELPVKWAADSKHFVYQKGNSIYFSTPDAMFKGLQVAEHCRRIGTGTIESVQWVNSDKLVFIDSDIIYLIDSREFATFGMYANYFPLGKILGRLWEKFSSKDMKFYVNSDASQIIIVKADSSVSYYELDTSGNALYVEPLSSFSHMSTLYNSYKIDVVWPKNSKPIFWVNSLTGAGASSGFLRNCSIFTFDSKNYLKELSSFGDTSLKVTVSNDGRYAAVPSANEVSVYTVGSWDMVEKIACSKIESICWRNTKELVVGNEDNVSVYNVETKKQKLLFLSSCKNAAWDSVTGQIIAKSKNDAKYSVYNPEKNTWMPFDSAQPSKTEVQNENYRIYTAKAKNARYDNGIYVRCLTGKVNTFALYKETVQKTAPGRKIALVFDLLDSADGLNSVIELCHKYNIRPTYFINGEFIRRYPSDTRKVALSGAEVGSLFYACVDLTDEFFTLSEDYIKNGLARNEDEYYQATKKELALLWHAPFYRSTKMIRDAGTSAGYSYIDFPVDYKSMDTKPGKTIESQIIPVTIGLSNPDSSETFAQKLELLINSLLDADYEIVPVSEL